LLPIAIDELEIPHPMRGGTCMDDETIKLPPSPDVEANASTSFEDAAAGEAPPHEVGWSIDKGLVRERNEDSLAAVTLSQVSEHETKSVGVYAVADGMGGHEAGEIASELAVRTAVRKIVDEVTEAQDPMPDNYQRWLEGAVALANRIVHNKAHEVRKNMGTTLVMAVIVGHDIHIVNVGDSRAYIISPGGIRQITRDHSFVQALLDSGAITPEEVAGHPRRNILTQSVGTEEAVMIDLFNEKLDDDEWLLLCSDGLWGMLSDEQIARIVQGASSPNEAARALVHATNAAGGSDNIAAVVVRPGSPTMTVADDDPTAVHRYEGNDDPTLVHRPRSESENSA
jgi:PPM family protein phosphatase